MKLNINIDYKFKEPQKDGEKEVTNQEITWVYIQKAVNEKHREGLDSQWRRVWGRLQDKFEEAIEKKEDVVELENAEKDFIKRAFDGVKLPASWSKHVALLEDELNKKE